MDFEPELTDEQAMIAFADPDDRLVVDAPPGTGKTHTLVARAIALSELDPPVNAIALTFSRNVVTEVSLRLSGAGVGSVSAWTIDGFALRLRRLAGEEIEFRGYDQGIRAATELLAEGGLPMLNLGHILVDEIQDLRGPRREFVSELIRVAGCGFTAFGDPGQAIYDFQEDHSDTDMFTYIVEEFDAEELSLSENFRNPDVSVPRADDAEQLEEHYMSLPPLGSVTDLRPWVRAGHPVVVLTRTNGQALRLALDLADAGIDADLNQRANYSPAPAWLLEVVESADESEISKDRFLEVARENAAIDDPEKAWKSVRAFIAPAKTLSALSVRNSIAMGKRFPGGIHHSDCVVSTIHRAKGLEWEIVVVADDGFEHPDADPEAEDRLRYVALTRAIDATYRLPLDYRYMKKDWRGRWILPYRGPGWKAIELIPGDVDDSVPFTGESSPELTARVQKYLRASVTSGDEVVVKRVKSGLPLTIRHKGFPIGRLSTQFVEAFSEAQVNKMLELTGLKILGLRVAGGDPEMTEECGLSDSGLWLVPEIAGLGFVKWSKKDE